jgi:hypothetical protein
MDLVKELAFIFIFYGLFIRLAVIWSGNLFFSGFLASPRPFVWILCLCLIGSLIPVISKIFSEYYYIPIVLLGLTVFFNRKPYNGADQDKELGRHYAEVGMKNWKFLRDTGWGIFLIAGGISIYLNYFSL